MLWGSHWPRTGGFHPPYTAYGLVYKGVDCAVCARMCCGCVFRAPFVPEVRGGVTPRFAAGFPRRRQAGVGESPGRRVQVADEAARAEAVDEGTEAPHEVKCTSYVRRVENMPTKPRAQRPLTRALRHRTRLSVQVTCGAPITRPRSRARRGR